MSLGESWSMRNTSAPYICACRIFSGGAGARDEDLRLEPGSRGIGGCRGADVARRLHGDHALAELDGPGDAHRQHAVLERSSRIARLVLQQERADADRGAESRRCEQRRVPFAQRHDGAAIADGQKVEPGPHPWQVAIAQQRRRPPGHRAQVDVHEKRSVAGRAARRAGVGALLPSTPCAVRA